MSALLASIFLSFAALVGGMNGLADLRGEAQPSNASAPLSHEAQAVVQRLQHYPRRSALGGINLAVSALLFAASVMITARRPSAVWLARQAVIANLLFIALRMAVKVHFVAGLDEELDPLANFIAEASGADPRAGASARDMTRIGMLAEEVGSGLVIGALHLYIGARASRDAVRRFVGDPEAPPADS